jgi:HlyD family secretion protein
MKKIWLVLLILIIGIGIAAAIVLRDRGHHPGDRIPLSGNIELEQVDIGFKMAGRLIERAVDEGGAVKKGMVVARLDRESLLRQREREQATLAGAHALLAQAETGVQWQQQTLLADREMRNADLRSAEARLQELRSGSRPQEIQEIQAVVQSAQAEYERAKKDWDRAQTLYKKDDISTSQYDQFRTRFEAAESTLHQSKERSALVVEGPRKETIEAAAAQVERARAGLKISEANELELQRREQELLARRAEIERAQAQVAVINSQLEDTVAASPIDGVVLVKSADVGEVLAPGSAVVTVGDIDHPWMRGYINERDLGRVKIGSPVRVKTDAFPNKEYKGRVSFIASEAEYTPKQIQTSEERVKLVYRIKMDIENPQRELKSNMPADAEILVGN